jgi:hypothetical protein
MPDLNQANDPSQQPKQGWVSKHHDKLYLAAILAVILIGIGAYWFLKEPRLPVAQNNGESTQTQEQQTPEETLELPEAIALSESETLLKADISQKFLIYAVKDKNHVNVYKRDLKSGQQSKIFEYDELSGAALSGNTWEELPPSVDFDPKKQRFVYSTMDGLKSYDLSTKATTSYITKVKDGAGEAPPTWNPPIEHAYSFNRPRWSADGRYVSFNLGQYEGTTISSYDTVTGKYAPFTFNGSAHGGYNISVTSKWSPVEPILLEPYGLYVSSPDDPMKFVDIATAHVSNDQGYPAFVFASFSPDGKRIVFTYRDKFDDEHRDDNSMSVINKDGTGFRVLSDKTFKTSPLFTPNGDVLYIIYNQDAAVMHRYSMASGKSEAVMTMPAGLEYWDISTEAFWTKEGHLALTGTHSQNPHDSSPPRAKFAILDIDKKEVVYSSANLPHHFAAIELTDK